MSRKARIDAPGALHHLIVRGIEREEIYKDNTIQARRTLCYIAVRKLGYKCSDVTTTTGITAVTVSKAVSLGSRVPQIGEIKKQLLGD